MGSLPSKRSADLTDDGRWKGLCSDYSDFRREIDSARTRLDGEPESANALSQYSTKTKTYLLELLLGGVCKLYADQVRKLHTLQRKNDFDDYARMLQEWWSTEKMKSVERWIAFYVDAQAYEWRVFEQTKSNHLIPSESHCFISHNGATMKELTFVFKQTIEQTLEKHGVHESKIFLDRFLEKGSNNRTEIVGAVLRSSVVLVFLNLEYYMSEWCILEWLLARHQWMGHKCRLVPVVPAARPEWESKLGTDTAYHRFLRGLPWGAEVTRGEASSYHDWTYLEECRSVVVDSTRKAFAKEACAKTVADLRERYRSYTLGLFETEMDDSRLGEEGLSNAFIEMTIRTRAPGATFHSADMKLGMPVRVEDLFNQDRRFVYVEGEAGSGKSTLCKYVSQKWALGEAFTEFDLIFLIELRELRDLEKTCPDDVLERILQGVGEVQRGAFRRSQSWPIENVLWIFDSLDEAEVGCTAAFSRFLNRLCNETSTTLPWAQHLLLTSRPEKKTPVGRKFAAVRIEGFNRDTINAYIERYFGDDSKLELEAKKFCERYQEVGQLFQTPLMLQLLCFRIKHRQKNMDTRPTLYSLYNSVLCECVPEYANSKWHLDSGVRCGLEDKWLGSLGELAFRHAGVFGQRELQRVDRADEIRRLGVISLTSGPRWSEQFCFKHDSFRQFFLARWVAEKPIKTVLGLLHNDQRFVFLPGKITTQWYVLSEALQAKQTTLREVALWLEKRHSTVLLQGLAWCGAVSLLAAACSVLEGSLEARVRRYDMNGDTPLTSAVRAARFECVELLVRHPKCCCAIDHPDYWGRSALEQAALRRDKAIVELLLANRAKPRGMRQDGHVELEEWLRREISAFGNCSTSKLRRETIQRLLNKRPKVNEVLLLASQFGNTGVFDLILDPGEHDTNYCDSGDRTQLYEVAKHGHKEIIKRLLSRGRLDIDSGLHGACEGGHLDVVEMLLSEGVDPDCRDSSGDTPLFLAAGYKHEHCIDILIKHDARNMDSGLRGACAGGHLDILESMLERGADVDGRGNNGWTPLYWAAIYDRKDCLERLLANDAADVDSGLRGASEGGHLQTVSLMVDKGADVDCRDPSGRTPLHLAARYGHNDCIEYLLGYDWVDFDSGLCGACAGGQLKVLDLMVGKGADVDYRDPSGGTPLYWAARYGHKECVTQLLDYSARTVNSGLRGACAGGQLEILELMLSRGAASDSVGPDGRTPLHWAALKGHHDCVHTLRQCSAPDVDSGLRGACEGGHLRLLEDMVAAGASVDCCDSKGRTPMFFAARYGHDYCISKLLKLDAANFEAGLLGASEGGHSKPLALMLARPVDVNCQDTDGHTPLFWAAHSGKENCVNMLLEHNPTDVGDGLRGAAYGGFSRVLDLMLKLAPDINCTDSAQRSPLYWAANGGHKYCVERLLEKGAHDFDGGLRGACSNSGSFNLFYLMLEKGANVHAVDSCGRSPLYLASWWGHRYLVGTLLTRGAVDVNMGLLASAESQKWDVFKLLLDNGADVNCSNAEGLTPLDWTSRHGRKVWVQRLQERGRTGCDAGAHRS